MECEARAIAGLRWTRRYRDESAVGARQTAEIVATG